MALVAAPLGSPHGCWIVSCPSISEWSEKDAAYCDWRQQQPARHAMGESKASCFAIATQLVGHTALQ